MKVRQRSHPKRQRTKKKHMVLQPVNHKSLKEIRKKCKTKNANQKEGQKGEEDEEKPNCSFGSQPKCTKTCNCDLF